MKNIYITWHYTNYGAAYFKHILSYFYKNGINTSQIESHGLNQVELNATFDSPSSEGFLFDEIIYLTAAQSTFDRLSSRRFAYKEKILEDKKVDELGLKEIFKKIIHDNTICYDLDKELTFVEKNYPNKIEEFKSVVWRNIQHYPVKEQIKWLTMYSNFKKIYLNRFKIVEIEIDDLRNESKIAEKINEWSINYFSKKKEVKPIINVSLGSTETQVVWHLLAEAKQLPNSTRFIKTYDDKSDTSDLLFKKFSILETPINLLSKITSSIQPYPKTNSPSRQLVNLKMEVFLKSGFSILLIGERGIGKSNIANITKNNKSVTTPFVEANCASFDIDSKAESELFGYVKGAFTGANANKKGLLEEANNGILFLDEIHHLSKLVQAKLMKALQTDSNNYMYIRKLGSNDETKVQCKLIFATNKDVNELSDLLLPDFYDRIVQHVIFLPSLRETIVDRVEDWTNVWKNLKLKDPCPKNRELLDWIKSLPLYGNYRDLQKIAIYYNIFEEFDENIISMLEEKTAFQYAKNEFEKYHSRIEKNNFSDISFKIPIYKNANEIEAEFKFYLQEIAQIVFGSRINASKQLGVTEKTLNDWKNKKIIKNKK